MNKETIKYFFLGAMSVLFFIALYGLLLAIKTDRQLKKLIDDVYLWGRENE